MATTSISSTASKTRNPCKRDRAIVAKGLGMQFRSGMEPYPVLQDIDLEIACGEVHLLMGPSGSGKTTLLSILGGLLKPTSGSVQVMGQEISRMGRSQLSQFRLDTIGFIFQEFNLFPALTALENVKVALEFKGIKGQAADRQAMDLLEQMEISDRAKQYPRDLSGGQKQRVAIARAFAGDPPLILADEPTAALDSHSGHAVMASLRQLAKQHNRTVIMVTHDPRMKDAADRVVYLEDGMLKAEEETMQAA